VQMPTAGQLAYQSLRAIGVALGIVASLLGLEIYRVHTEESRHHREMALITGYYEAEWLALTCSEFQLGQENQTVHACLREKGFGRVAETEDRVLYEKTMVTCVRGTLFTFWAAAGASPCVLDDPGEPTTILLMADHQRRCLFWVNREGRFALLRVDWPRNAGPDVVSRLRQSVRVVLGSPGAPVSNLLRSLTVNTGTKMDYAPWLGRG